MNDAGRWVSAELMTYFGIGALVWGALIIGFLVWTHRSKKLTKKQGGIVNLPTRKNRRKGKR